MKLACCRRQVPGGEEFQVVFSKSQLGSRRPTLQWNGDSSVVRASDSWSKGLGFESRQDRRENFLLQGQLSVRTLISVSVPPPCYRSSM